MNRKHFTLLSLLVIFGVLFTLSSCSEAGSETPRLAFEEHTLTYAPINGVENREITAVSPKWEPQLASANLSYTSADLPEGLTLDAQTGVIRGTIPTVMDAQTFTITATATGTYSGVVTATVSIIVLHSYNLADYGFKYEPALISASVGAPVSASPEWTTALELPDAVSYSIENADTPPADLPTGLTFEETTGVISGRVEEEAPKRDYTITVAPKDGAVYTGNATFTISITVLTADNISGYTLSYPIENKIEGVVGTLLTATPSWDPTFAPGTTGISYKIDPALPGELEFDTRTGVISGKPTTAAPEQTYKITANASESYTGTKSVSVGITIFDPNDIAGPDYSLSYPELTTTLVGKDVTIAATWTRRPDTIDYTASPALPKGLSFNTDTGAIEGTPEVATGAKTYTVTATAPPSSSHIGSLTTKEFTITITPIDISTNSLSYGDISIEVNRQIEGTGFLPTWKPVLDYPDAVSYRIEPSLATKTPGLSFNTETGAITGTPTTIAEAQSYTVTATAKNPGAYTGRREVQVSITITNAPQVDIGTFNFTYPLATGALGDISAAPLWGDGTPEDLMVTYAITPDLPAGLTLNSDGSITGSFVGLPHATAYKVTATGTGAYKGSTEAVFLDNLLLLGDYTASTAGSAIDSREKLAAMANDRTGTYHLTNHIDLGPEPAADPGSTDHYWTPLFSSTTPFTGTLHGNGYAIYNLTIEGGTKDYQGLFAAIGAGATVENLGIGVTRITGGGGIGALAGYAIGTFDNITAAAMSTPASGATITANDEVYIVYSGTHVGGLVGHLGSTASGTDATLIGNNVGLSVSGGAGRYIGGLVGWNNGVLTGYATGAVSGAINVGGLAGANWGSIIGYTTSSVIGTTDVGGLVGTGNRTGYMIGYATGDVSGTNNVGGLAGTSNGFLFGYANVVLTASSPYNNIGGLAGVNWGTVTGYATGTVPGSGDGIGGLVGKAEDGSVITGYWDEGSTGRASGVGTGTLTDGAVISATKDIVYAAPSSYTVGTDPIFDASAFANAFNLTAGANATWPKLKTSFITTVNSVEITINFPLPQPTVRDTDENDNIDVVWPWEQTQ